MDKKEKLKKIILETSISENEKKLWENFIDVSEEKDIFSILDFLENNPREIDFLTENLKEKIKVLNKKDYFEKASDFRKIIEKEENYFSNIAG